MLPETVVGSLGADGSMAASGIDADESGLGGLLDGGDLLRGMDRGGAWGRDPMSRY